MKPRFGQRIAAVSNGSLTLYPHPASRLFTVGVSYDGWDEPGFALTGYMPASYTADRFLSFDIRGALLSRTEVGLSMSSSSHQIDLHEQMEDIVGLMCH